MINRIFVSLYIEYNKIDKYNHFIGKYVISENDKDYSELIKVLSFLKSQNVEEIRLEDMINLFEFVISPSDRIVTGAIYTPKIFEIIYLDDVWILSIVYMTSMLLI